MICSLASNLAPTNQYQSIILSSRPVYHLFSGEQPSPENQSLRFGETATTHNSRRRNDGGRVKWRSSRC
ncbi:hypothetical protein LINGRAHAP2_LOCUS23314 [Linum grandiflorum]